MFNGPGGGVSALVNETLLANGLADNPLRIDVEVNWKVTVCAGAGMAMAILAVKPLGTEIGVTPVVAVQEQVSMLWPLGTTHAVVRINESAVSVNNVVISVTAGGATSGSVYDHVCVKLVVDTKLLRTDQTVAEKLTVVFGDGRGTVTVAVNPSTG